MAICGYNAKRIAIMVLTMIGIVASIIILILCGKIADALVKQSPPVNNADYDSYRVSHPVVGS